MLFRSIRILRERARLLVNDAKTGKMRADNESQAALAACVLLLAVLEDDIKEWIEKGEFTLTEPVRPKPSVSEVKPLNMVQVED